MSDSIKFLTWHKILFIFLIATLLLVIAAFFWAQKYLNSPLKETTVNQSIRLEAGELEKIKKLP